MKRMIVLVILFVLSAWAGAQTVAEHLATGDAAYDRYDNAVALKHYQAAWKVDSTDCDVLWKIARSHIDIGELADEKTQKVNYYLGEKFARAAVRHCPNSADAHVMLAVSVGRVALMVGGKKKVELSKEVKAEVEKALELDPNQDIAHHVLARWHREVTHLSGFLKTFAKILYGGLPPASDEKAVAHFTKALQIKPNYINHHLEMGITYEAMKQWEAARAEYRKVAELPIGAFNDQQHKKEAAERLAKILDKK